MYNVICMMSVATCIPDSVSLSLSCLSEGDLTVVENVLTVYNHTVNDGLSVEPGDIIFF